MTFILSDQRTSDVVAAFQRYREYLERSRRDFPRGAYSLATSEWYYNAEDHRCPHDAWLEEVALFGDRDRVAPRSAFHNHVHPIARLLP